jgi:hypothetical protein
MIADTFSALEKYLLKSRLPDEKLDASLQSIQDITDFMNNVTQFLTLVDEALDLSKTLAL